MKKYIFLIIGLALILNMGNYLDLTDTTNKSDIIVVLGGGKDSRIKQGLALYQNDYSKSKKILFTGKDKCDTVIPSFNKSQFLLDNAVNNSNIINVINISNTMEELLEVKRYALQHNIKSILFVSHPTHSRRIKILANLIANYDDSNIKISFAAADHTKVWNKNLYFLNVESIKLVTLETAKIFYNLIKYKIFL